MFYRIHVNQHVLRSNAKTGERKPPITIKGYTNAKIKSHKTNTYAHGVEIKGTCKLVYCPDNPLPCGGVLWLEVDSSNSEVIVSE